MNFDVWTFGLQAANFLVLVWLLHRFLYRPVLKVIAERQAATNKLTVDLKAEKAAAEAVRQGLERERAGIAKERDASLRAAREAADAERKALLAKAREEADDITNEAQKALERERADVLSALGQDAARLAVSIVRRLLRDAPAASLQERMLELVCKDVRSLSAEAKQQIAERVAADDGTVVVVTAARVDERGRERFAASLAKALGAPLSPAFKVDPKLIAGVEVGFPFTILRRAWSEDLKRIEAELGHDDGAPNVA